MILQLSSALYISQLTLVVDRLAPFALNVTVIVFFHIAYNVLLSFDVYVTLLA